MVHKNNNKVLVTGANGFLGKHLCEFLDNNKISYRAAVRKSNSTHEHETGDLNQFSDWNTLFKDVDCIIHAAAKAHDMSGSADLKNIYNEVNTNLTLRLAQEAKNSNVRRFIFISTIKVNGEFTHDSPFRAEDTPNPTDDYGISKLNAETELLKLHEKGVFEVVIIRPCLIYGKGVKANFDSLIKIVKKGWPLPFASIKNKRSFVAIDNLIDLIYLCTSHPNAAGQIFLVSDNKDLSLPELIKNIGMALGKKTVLLPFPTVLFKLFFKIIGKSNFSDRLFSNLQVDISKNKDLLDWTPPYTLQESFKKMF